MSNCLGTLHYHFNPVGEVFVNQCNCLYESTMHIQKVSEFSWYLWEFQ